jgi:STE24 endopeptidase
MNAFTWIFLGALGASAATRLWLALRQVRSVRAHRARVPAPFGDSIPLAAHQKAADYTDARVRFGMLDIVVGALVLLVLTLGGGIDWIAQQWATLFDAGGIAHGIALMVSVVALLALVDLPLEIYRVFGIEARFGFNRMTAALFVADLARQMLVGAILGVPLAALVLWLMQSMGEHWWLYVWFAWMGFNLLVLLIYPTFIAPLFNRFTPLEDRSLAGRIEALLARCGFRAQGLFVMDGSKRSSHGNAYFTGFGAAKRIVFFDTLLSRLAASEIEAVLAHELGHFRRHHVWKRIALLGAFSLGLLWLLGRLIEEPWFYEGLNVATRTTASALLLFMLTVPLFAFFLQPLASLYSRSHEFEADAYAAAHVDSRELVHALVKLYQDNASTLTPDPLHSAFYDSHPPAASRIARLSAAPALSELRPTP